ncbi:MAG: hypothetical protein WBQ49_10605 [Rhodomicrobium sp.]
MQHRSLCAASGVSLVGVKDVVSSVFEVEGVFDHERWGLAWIENGLGDAIGVALSCEEGPGGWKHMRLTVDDKFQVSLEGGVTAETMVRLALSELRFSSRSVVALTLFSDPYLLKSPQLLYSDGELEQRVLALRKRQWPRIFPQEHYLDKHGPRDLSGAWAMVRHVHEVQDRSVMRGCNLFLQKFLILRRPWH